MLAATDPETGQTLSDNEIADELIVFLFAGHDTTATTLTYAMWQLGRHPDIQERVAAEVAALPDRELTPDDVAEPALHRAGAARGAAAVSARRPPARGWPRATSRWAATGSSAGTMLIFGRLAVQRDPTLWEDPLTFDPDRFTPGQN